MEDNKKGTNLSFNWLGLPEAMQMEILKRIPVDHLFRSKSVSKSWYHLISTIYPPLSGLLYIGQIYFKDNYFLDYIPFSCYDDNKNIETKGSNFMSSLSSVLPFNPTHEDFLDCCNGLLLFFKNQVLPSEFFVCNPFTKQCIPIPLGPSHNRKSAAFLAFDPTLSSNYRIILLSRVSMEQWKVDVFSSGTGKWVIRYKPIAPEIRDSKITRRGVYLNGFLYLLTTSRYYLLRFDKNFNCEQYELPLKDKTDPHGFIGTSNGNLVYSNNDAVNVLVWSFKDSNKSGDIDCFWTLKHKIAIRNLGKDSYWSIFKKFHSEKSEFMPYAVHPFSGVIVMGIPDIIFSYHPQTGCFEELFTAKEDSFIVCGRTVLYCYRRCTIVLEDF